MIVGILKPKGPTSHDMIYKVRRITHEKRVGHAGTLDPMASGVLVVAIGRESTKKLSSIVQHDKEYVATVQLGAVSTTDDAEGTITPLQGQTSQAGREQIDAVLPQFTGTIRQVPPAFSAIKIGGRKSYDLARKGKAIELEAREVVIHSIEVVAYEWPTLVIKVHCGKGVYIRSLARDIGKALGTGGYLTALERTRVGDFTTETSMTVEAFEKYWNAASDAVVTPTNG